MFEVEVAPAYIVKPLISSSACSCEVFLRRLPAVLVLLLIIVVAFSFALASEVLARVVSESALRFAWVKSGLATLTILEVGAEFLGRFNLASSGPPAPFLFFRKESFLPLEQAYT